MHLPDLRMGDLSRHRGVSGRYQDLWYSHCTESLSGGALVLGYPDPKTCLRRPGQLHSRRRLSARISPSRIHRWIDESCLCKRTKESLLYGREGCGVDRSSIIDHPPVRVAELDCDLTAWIVLKVKGVSTHRFSVGRCPGETLFNVEDAGDEIFFGPGVVAWRYDRQIIGLD